MAFPPGPQSPLFVQALHIKTRPLEYLEECAERYGDMFTAGGSPSSRSVYISRPSAIQEVLTADRDLFAPPYHDGGAGFLFGPGSMVFRVGEDHQRARRLLAPPFHGERLRANAATITSVTAKAIDHWHADEPFSVAPAMRDITLRVIFRLVFESDEGERLQRLRHLFNLLMTLLSSPWRVTLFRLSSRIPVEAGGWTSLAATKGEIDRLLYEEIRERRAVGRSTSSGVLTLLLSAEDAAGAPLSDQDVHGEIMTLLFAGHETTASALAWALYRLHHAPAVLDRLQGELGTCAVWTDALEISRLAYLAAVCQETLRLYPPALGAVRVLKAPMTVAGYRLEAGTTLVLSIYLTHRRADLYPQPQTFDPGRFVGRQFSASEYLPFGGGHRTCLGMTLALFEMKLVLATILSRWQLALADRRLVTHRRRVLTAGPGGNMRLVPVRENTRQGTPSRDPVPPQ